MKLTELERVLLAQLNRRPRTGYELGKAFDGTPMGTFSSSPGSIYPALGRLETAGLLRPVDQPQGRRPRREFHLTAAGRRKLEGWTSAPIEPVDLLKQPGVLALRYSFLASPEERTDFLERYRAAASAGFDLYAASVRGAKGQATATSIGSLELARDLYAAHRTWAKREQKRLQAKVD